MWDLKRVRTPDFESNGVRPWRRSRRSSLRAGQSCNLTSGFKVWMGLLNQGLPMVSTEGIFMSLGSAHV